MNKTELIEKLKAHYEIVLEDKIKTSDVEEGISHCSIPVFAKKDDCLIRQWIHFYVNEKDEAFWSERNPIAAKVVLTPEQINNQQLQAIKTDAKEMSELVKIGLEPQSSFDAIKAGYDTIKNNALKN